jgi:hypothetical protein
MTDTDVAMLSHGIGKFAEATMLAGHDEGARSLSVSMSRHHSSSA